jgi:hypothetical protein
VDFEAWAQSMQPQVDAFLRQTWEAMRVARRGHWIEDTEEQVHQAGEEFRRKAMEQLLQRQIEEAQKSFSPSARNQAGQQGLAAGDASDGGRPCGATPAGLAAARRRVGHSGG